jgi:hypothetical protein
MKSLQFWLALHKMLLNGKSAGSAPVGSNRSVTPTEPIHLAAPER